MYHKSVEPGLKISAYPEITGTTRRHEPIRR